MKDSLRFDIYFVASIKESSFNCLVNKLKMQKISACPLAERVLINSTWSGKFKLIMKVESTGRKVNINKGLTDSKRNLK